MGTTKTTGEAEKLADAPHDPDQTVDPNRSKGVRAKLTTAKASAKSASEQHVALAVPLRAAERNRRVAASVLAGGLAYRLFLWLLPFGLIVGGALGFSNTTNTEKAVSSGGLPGAISNAIGDASRSAHSSSWWLLAVGVPLSFWRDSRALRRWNSSTRSSGTSLPAKTKPLQGSLAFTGVLLAVWAIVALTWWVRGSWPGLLAPVITVVPLAALWLWVSLHLPHRDAPWKALLPGALLVGIGFNVLHELVLYFLVPKLEKSTSLYGSLGATTTVIFFIYLLATLAVTAPVLNSSLHHELRKESDAERTTVDEPSDDAG